MAAAKIVNPQIKIPVAFLAILALITGCQTSIYYWGHYENLVYDTYAKPEKVPPEMQVHVMEEDLAKAGSANKPLPPGFHAHLGYEYYLLGKTDLALQQFQQEKKEFPESTVFMDRVITGLTKK